MCDRFYLHGLPCDCVAAADDSGPKIERLIDRVEIIGSQSAAVIHETDPPERNRVRIFAEVGTRGAVLQTGVEDRSSMKRVGFHGVGEGQVLCVGKRVPCPRRQRLQRKAVVVIELFERLQAGHINSEGEIAVADTDGRFRIETRGVDVVAAHQGLAVDWLCNSRRRCHRRQNKTGDDLVHHERSANLLLPGR